MSSDVAIIIIGVTLLMSMFLFSRLIPIAYKIIYNHLYVFRDTLFSDKGINIGKNRKVSVYNFVTIFIIVFITNLLGTCPYLLVICMAKSSLLSFVLLGGVLGMSIPTTYSIFKNDINYYRRAGI